MSPDFPAFWGILIEKAWAKAFSNYKSLGKGGYSCQSMRALTGAPVDNIYLKPYTAWSVFSSIYYAKAKGWLHNLETVSSPDASGDTKQNACGITYSHAYSLLDAF